MGQHGMTVGRGIWGKKPESGSERGKRGAARIRRLRLELLLGVAAVVMGAGLAFAADISVCGTTITKSGFYRVSQDLIATRGDCIDVNAARTIVFLNGHQLSGAGAGVGVKFSSRAAHSFLEGGNANISGFAIGVEDDAGYVRGDNFNANGNGIGGVLIDRAQSSTFSNFQASNNGSYGVRFMAGDGNVAESAQATATATTAFGSTAPKKFASTTSIPSTTQLQAFTSDARATAPAAPAPAASG